MADIIDFANVPKPATNDRLFKRDYKPGTSTKFCRLHRFEYDTHDQSVWCSVCEKVFSGFEAFLEVARTWEHMRESRDQLTSEVRSLKEKRDRLEKDVNNLKAQARRLGRTSPRQGDEP